MERGFVIALGQREVAMIGFVLAGKEVGGGGTFGIGGLCEAGQGIGINLAVADDLFGEVGFVVEGGRGRSDVGSGCSGGGVNGGGGAGVGVTAGGGGGGGATGGFLSSPHAMAAARVPAATDSNSVFHRRCDITLSSTTARDWRNECRAFRRAYRSSPGRSSPK